MRRADSVPPDFGRATPAAEHRWEIPLRAVTPIYKGGSTSSSADHDPFRGPSIRGQLRYWWRATRDTTNVAELRDQERALFGGVFGSRAAASKMRLHLTDQRSTLNADRPAGLDYATWVDRPGADRPNRLYHHDATATLHLSVPKEHQEELTTTLAAWTSFGGIGGRSRRGLGAVRISEGEFSDRVDDLRALEQRLVKLKPRAAARRWPSLGGAQLFVEEQPCNSALLATKRALNTMRELRSYGRRIPAYKREYMILADVERGPIEGVRAALGLPIPFQSKSNKFPGRREMRPSARGHDRLPSPIHICPVKVGGQWMPAMLVLPLWATPAVQVSKTHHEATLNPKGLVLFTDELLTEPGWIKVGAP